MPLRLICCRYAIFAFTLRAAPARARITRRFVRAGAYADAAAASADDADAAIFR